MVTVSLTRFDGSLESIGRSIELCDGFAGLDRSAHVLIKPNISYAGWVPIPPYGMVTTARVIEGILRALSEHGCKHVCIAEGSISNVLESNTLRGYKYTGIQQVAKRYDAKLLDLNKGPFVMKELGEVKVSISKAVLESEFLINVPVLKTHSQVKVSLGFKNLKGCLDVNSRKLFHRNELEHLIYLLNELIKCDLTIIDGIYMLEKGPDTVLGTAHRKDLIIASRDKFACDCVGASILGINTSEVGYLVKYAQAHNLPLDISKFDIKGLIIGDLKEKLEWRSDAELDLLRRAGITGLSVPHPGHWICSGCYTQIILALAILSRQNPNQNFAETVVLCGGIKATEAMGTKFLLFGSCAIKENKDLKYMAFVPGCPPTLTNTLGFLFRGLLSHSGRAKMLLAESSHMVALRAGIDSGLLPHWKRYRHTPFDMSHFATSSKRANF